MVPGSIPGGVTGFFSDIFPSDRTMALGSTQPLVKMSTRNIPGGKGGRCVRLTTSPPSRVEYHEILEPKPPGTLWATPGLWRDSFTFTYFVLDMARCSWHLGLVGWWPVFCIGIFLKIKDWIFNSISIYYCSERTCGSGEEGDSKGEPGENSEEGKEYL